MLEKFRSEVRVTYSSTMGNVILEVLMVLFTVGSLLFHLQLLSLTATVVFFVLLGVMWLLSYIRFRKNAQIGLVKCCSLQLIICGLLGAAFYALCAWFLPAGAYRSSLIILLLLAVTAGLNVLCYRERRTVLYVTFLLLPYCILSADLFLVTGFLSAMLLMIALFNGTLLFEHERMGDDEYFGNSNH